MNRELANSLSDEAKEQGKRMAHERGNTEWPSYAFGWLSQSIATHLKSEHWYDDVGEVAAFGRHLVGEGFSTEELQGFYDNPRRWCDEYDLWKQCGFAFPHENGLTKCQGCDNWFQQIDSQDHQEHQDRCQECSEAAASDGPYFVGHRGVTQVPG